MGPPDPWGSMSAQDTPVPKPNIRNVEGRGILNVPVAREYTGWINWSPLPPSMTGYDNCLTGRGHKNSGDMVPKSPLGDGWRALQPTG